MSNEAFSEGVRAANLLYDGIPYEKGSEEWKAWDLGFSVRAKLLRDRVGNPKEQRTRVV
jgi:hypothetical protein